MLMYRKKALMEAHRLEEQGINVEFIAVGNKDGIICGVVKKNMSMEISGINDVPTFAEAQRIAKLAVSNFYKGTMIGCC